MEHLSMPDNEIWLLITCGMFMFLGCFFAAFVFSRILMAIRSSNWPVVDGMIIESKIKTKTTYDGPSGPSNFFVPSIKYCSCKLCKNGIRNSKWRSFV